MYTVSEENKPISNIEDFPLHLNLNMSYSKQGGQLSSSRKTQQLNNQELEKKLIRHKKKIEVLKEDNENLINQLSFLKEEIKKYKMESEEKNKLLSKILKNSKAANEKKVYDDCLKIFNERFSNQAGYYSDGKVVFKNTNSKLNANVSTVNVESDVDSGSEKKKEKGFLSFFSSK